MSQQKAIIIFYQNEARASLILRLARGSRPQMQVTSLSSWPQRRLVLKERSQWEKPRVAWGVMIIFEIQYVYSMCKRKYISIIPKLIKFTIFVIWLRKIGCFLTTLPRASLICFWPGRGEWAKVNFLLGFFNTCSEIGKFSFPSLLLIYVITYLLNYKTILFKK